MKKFLLAALMLVGFSGLHLEAQNDASPSNGLFPRAGQTLSVNPLFELPQTAGRVIDFDSLNMTFTGNWPAGQSFSISASPTGDTLFAGEGGMMNVLDVTDPYNPVLIAEIRARAIIDDSYYDPATARLYLAAYFSGIEVWELGDFTTPQRICRIPTNSYPRGGVYAVGNLVYVTTVADGFYVFDITNPGNPVEVGHRTIGGNPLVWDSDYEGNFAYLAASNNGMKVINFSNPADPVVAGAFSGMTTGLCVLDTLVYVASSSLGFRILNVKNPASITLAGSCTLPGYPARVTVAGDYAYVANATTASGGGINVIDIHNPGAPVHVTTYGGYQSYVAGGMGAIGATGGTEGVLILDVTDPELPVQAATRPMAGFLYELTVNGNLAYTGSNGFRVFNLTDLTHPVQIGHDATPGALVAPYDTLAIYINKSMTANNPVNIMSIADPQHPYKISHYMAPVMTYDLALKGQYAFVACWWDGFRVVDFSDPSSPTLKAHEFGWHNGAVPGEEFCYVQALDIFGDYLYLIDYLPFPDEDTKGLYIFDISDPENPQFVSRYASLTSSGQDLRAWENYVYVADGSGGMEVIDISDPLFPVSIGYCSLPDGATGMDISWPFVFVSNYILGGIEVIDVTVPQAPFITAYYRPTGVFAEGVDVSSTYALVGDGVCGFQVYDMLNATGVKDVSVMNISELSVSPNPSRGIRKISFAVEEGIQVDLQVTDLAGRPIFPVGKMNYEKGSHEIYFDDRSLPSGVYLLRVSTGKEGRAVKFIVD